MSNYLFDEMSPEWEPAPWPLDAQAAQRQELGFRTRAQLSIRWQAIPWKSFPIEGIFWEFY